MPTLDKDDLRIYWQVSDMERKEFAVVAGPNGAGKSSLSKYYLKVDCFDGDLMALNLRREHPDWPERWISGTVAGNLEKQKNNAIASNQNFAFETNFSNDFIINLINDFKKSNYKISLFYFGIDKLDESLLRVHSRANLGGHNVADDVVKYNFSECPKRVAQNLHLFDYMIFIDGIMPYGKIIANIRKRDNYKEIADIVPRWFADGFAGVVCV